MNSNTKPNGYGYLTLTRIPDPRNGQVRVQSAGHTEDGLSLFTIPKHSAGSSGINFTVNGKCVASFHHLAVDTSHIAFAYNPDNNGGYRDFRRLGPCTIEMDGARQ